MQILQKWTIILHSQINFVFLQTEFHRCMQKGIIEVIKIENSILKILSIHY